MNDISQLSNEELREVDRIAVQFERECQTGQRPNLKPYIDQVSTASLQTVLLRELLLLDLDYRNQASEVTSVEHYVQDYPEWAETIESVFSEVAAQSAPESRETVRSSNTRPNNTEHETSSTEALKFPVSDPVLESRFELLGLLGEGRYGRVFHGFDKTLERDVALKFPRHSSAGPHPKSAASIHEAATTAKINHPNVVKIYDVIALPNDYACIVMDLVDGEVLDSEREHRTWIEVATLVARLARTINHPHRLGIYHLDLKPANILIDSQGEPHITDFGLAVREVDQHAQAGHVRGTPAYMSPEQTRGELHLVDGRADIWSLGVLLYEMTTQQRPFVAPETKALFEQIQNRSPKPMRQIDDSIPKELEFICMKALAKDPVDRYQTGLDMARDLERIVKKGGSHLPTGLSVPQRAKPLGLLAGALAVACLTVVAFANWERWFPAATDVAPDLTEAQGDSREKGDSKEVKESGEEVTESEVSVAQPLIHQTRVTRLQLSADGSYLISVDANHQLQHWRTRPRLEPIGDPVSTSVQRLQCLWVSSSGRSFWFSSVESPGTLFGVQDGEMRTVDIPDDLRILSLVDGETQDVPDVFVDLDGFRRFDVSSLSQLKPESRSDEAEMDHVVLDDRDPPTLIAASRQLVQGAESRPFLQRVDAPESLIQLPFLPHSLALDLTRQELLLAGYDGATGLWYAKLSNSGDLEWQQAKVIEAADEFLASSYLQVVSMLRDDTSVFLCVGRPAQAEHGTVVWVGRWNNGELEFSKLVGLPEVTAVTIHPRTGQLLWTTPEELRVRSVDELLE